MGVLDGKFWGSCEFCKNQLSDSDDLIIFYQKLTEFLTDLDETQNIFPRSVVEQLIFSWKWVQLKPQYT